MSLMVFFDDWVDQRGECFVALLVSEVNTNRTVLVGQPAVHDVLQGHAPRSFGLFELAEDLLREVALQSGLAVIRPRWELHVESGKCVCGNESRINVAESDSCFS